MYAFRPYGAKNAFHSPWQIRPILFPFPSPVSELMESKLKGIFAESLGIPESSVSDSLTYAMIPQWDSVAHMALIAAIEEGFDIMIDTEDVIDMSNFEKAKQIVAKYL